jgi:hypothetical protein
VAIGAGIGIALLVFVTLCEKLDALGRWAKGQPDKSPDER